MLGRARGLVITLLAALMISSFAAAQDSGKKKAEG